MAKQTDPQWPTQKRARFSGGRVAGVDNSMWIYRAVPLSPVIDAKSPADVLAAADPLIRIFDDIAASTKLGVLARRNSSKGSYRKAHLLLVNIPANFTPPTDSGLAPYLRASFPQARTERRLLLLGVKLREKLGGSGTFRDRSASLVESVVSGAIPLSEYDADYKAMATMMAQAGLTEPSVTDFALSDAWWNFGVSPDTPTLEHPDHLHIFSTSHATATAKNAEETGVPCAAWPLIPNHHILTFGTVQDFRLGFTPAESAAAHWVNVMLAAEAVAVSIRFRVEPVKVTRNELRRRRRQYLADIEERAQAGKMERAEQEEMLKDLTDMEAWYSGPAEPTLTEVSTVFALSGAVDEVADLGRDHGLTLNPMSFRQTQALREMMISSSVAASPHLHDLPAQTVACSAISSLAVVGDNTGQRILLGMSERDSQPAWLSPTAATDEETLPFMLVAGQTGSGKDLELSTKIPTPTGTTTMGELRIGDQVFGRDGKPCRVTFMSDIKKQPDLYEITLSDGQKIHANIEHQWLLADGDTRAELDWNGAQNLIGDLIRFAGRFPGDAEMTLTQLHDAVSAELGSRMPWVNVPVMGRALEFLDCPSVVPAQAGAQALYPAAVAVKTLAVRVSQQYSDPSSVQAGEVRMTTGEMLAADLRLDNGLERFAIRATEPLDLPEADLPMDPHEFGLWIADASAKGEQRIPDVYLRASIEQRREVLDGVIAAAGCYDRAAGCELLLREQGVALDCLELVRSLGMPAALSAGPAGGWTVRFGVSTEQWLRIVSIEPTESKPSRCISVDSSDHTYLAAGMVPTSNTMSMLWMADQAARLINQRGERTPVIMFDPKKKSDHSAVVLASGGQVYSLDDLVAADGVFDALRFSANTTVGIELASSLLMTVNPWGSQKLDYEAPLLTALRYGVDHGATCTGQALRMAADAPDATAETKKMVTKTFEVAGAVPMFRAFFGIDPKGTALKAAQGITLIKVGDAHIDLPEAGSEAGSLTQRATLALIRAVVYGSMMALANRQGMLLLDEAWVILGAGRAEIERVGREARSQEVMPVLFTQRVTDALNANLAGYISRGLILAIQDRTEARAACELFRVEPTPELIGRITAPATVGGAESKTPNFQSLRALRDPVTRETFRGSVGLYADLSNRFVPVEITIPKAFLEVASTTPEDIRRRLAGGEKVGVQAAAAVPREFDA